MDGKAWQKITDADLMIVKKNSAGKYEVGQVEQIKSGERDRAGDARNQLNQTVEALESIGANDSSVRILAKRNNQDVNITGEYDLKNVKNAKFVTRRADNRPHFDETIGVTSQQIKELANDIITKHQARGGN